MSQTLMKIRDVDSVKGIIQMLDELIPADKTGALSIQKIQI